ncbi:hypothetical protein [Paraburkholderia terrae]
MSGWPAANSFINIASEGRVLKLLFIYRAVIINIALDLGVLEGSGMGISTEFMRFDMQAL